jgi:hypothetical protein
LASEIVFLPALALAPGVGWTPVDDSDVVVHVPYGGDHFDVTLSVALSGTVEKVTIPRWASVAKGPFREHLFGADLLSEATFDGYTIPTTIVAGYDYGCEHWPDCAFIRQVIDHATFH